jgi:hypothetical protein
VAHWPPDGIFGGLAEDLSDQCARFRRTAKNRLGIKWEVERRAVFVGRRA